MCLFFYLFFCTNNNFYVYKVGVVSFDNVLILQRAKIKNIVAEAKLAEASLPGDTFVSLSTARIFAMVALKA